MLKQGSFPEIHLKLQQMLVAFALLGSNQYMDLLLVQLAIWAYQTKTDHPMMDVLNASPRTFVGEDIELFNRLLSQHSQHDSRRSEATLLDHSYRKLGYIVHSGMTFNAELVNSTQFLKGNRRYCLDVDGPEVDRARGFFGKLFTSFANNAYYHYEIPREPLKKKTNGVTTILPMDIKNCTTYKLSTINAAVQQTELEGIELIDVRYIASTNWVDVLSVKFEGLVRRDWKFKEHLKPETLTRLEQEFPEYVGYPRPSVPRARGNKRKRSTR